MFLPIFQINAKFNSVQMSITYFVAFTWQTKHNFYVHQVEGFFCLFVCLFVCFLFVFFYLFLFFFLFCFVLFFLFFDFSATVLTFTWMCSCLGMYFLCIREKLSLSQNVYPTLRTDMMLRYVSSLHTSMLTASFLHAWCVSPWTYVG